MTNNTLFCGVVLIGLGLYAYFKDAPDDKWDEAKAALADKQTAEAKAKDSEASKVDPEKINKKDQYEAAKVALAERKTAKAREKDANAPEVDTAKVMEVSRTALLPAAFGLVILLCAGLVIWKESLRKTAMHVAAAVAVVGVFAGFYPLVKHLGDPDHQKFDFTTAWNLAGIRAGLLMSLVCLVFVVMAVMSFMEARASQARARGTAPTPAV